jgi:hypothetical protein
MTEPRRRALALRLRTKCSARECRRRATTILRYLDNQRLHLTARGSDILLAPLKGLTWYGVVF